MADLRDNARKLHFDVSSGLKTVLGSELITDDEVAIFELVKNSFDADARHVDIVFANDAIVISDNGHGMNYEDILGKWLLVAYSSKRNEQKSDFRDTISDRRHYAGSKGIGRFSADRLGSEVVLQTRSAKEQSGPVHKVRVNWDLFDRNHKTHFENIKLDYAEQRQFELPEGAKRLSHGTVISVQNVRRPWNRDALLRLKAGLAKLINPFGAASDGFTISIFAPAEKEADQGRKAQARAKGVEVLQTEIVNGPVQNFIFDTLQQKTTFIDVRLDATGTFLESALTDRGELIYRIREPNPYPSLSSSGFHCEMFFLNTSAKLTFGRRMGVPSVQFGSIFVFRNGFRVFPMGEEGNDWFEMDRRKQQGFRRFLGTRDVIGRIQVLGTKENEIEEASSRNAGLIDSPAVQQLRVCFMEHCLKRLERYVVPVTFPDTEDRNSEDISRLLTDPGRARVASAVAKLVDSEDIELLAYSKRLIGILNTKSAQFEASLGSLRMIAEKTQDRALLRRIEEAEDRFEDLRRSEEKARKQADEERAAKEAAQARAEKAEREATETKEQLEEEKKRSLFLASISTLDTDTILNLHHQVTIYAVDLQQQIENFMVKMAGERTVSTTEVIGVLESIALLNRRIMGVSKFATKANFRLESEKIKADLGEYVRQYITGVARDFLQKRRPYPSVTVDKAGPERWFKPIDISVVIDNLIANAKKAKASEIDFNITHPTKDTIHIHVSDNGIGFHDKIPDLSRVFEKGFTMTEGSGLGLYHVQHVLGEMNGTIEAQRKTTEKGATFTIKIAK